MNLIDFAYATQYLTRCGASREVFRVGLSRVLNVIGSQALGFSWDVVAKHHRIYIPSLLYFCQDFLHANQLTVHCQLEPLHVTINLALGFACDHTKV